MIIDLQHRGISILNESALTDFIDKHLELKAERDQALEVIREYRKIHPGCCIRIAGLVNETKLDGRCPTCIKADALLARKTKET